MWLDIRNIFKEELIGFLGVGDERKKKVRNDFKVLV